MQDELRRLIAETANSMGMNPIDLATIISYETAGTLSPTQPGPRTQWGQHRGLIQFGEPQAKTYGVDWNDPLNSQLGSGKAVEKYFRASGWKPGMSMLDAYSVVNAGGPGLYGASDAQNGGAPGNVRDKVNSAEMAAHRKKAMALMGSDLSPGALDFVKNNPQPGGFGPAVPDPNNPPSLFGSMSPGGGGQPMAGPAAADAQWALSPDKKKDTRLSDAGAAFSRAAKAYPAPSISGGGGDARETGGNLIKLLLSDPGALAKALMGKRMA